MNEKYDERADRKTPDGWQGVWGAYSGSLSTRTNSSRHVRRSSWITCLGPTPRGPPNFGVRVAQVRGSAHEDHRTTATGEEGEDEANRTKKKK